MPWGAFGHVVIKRWPYDCPAGVTALRHQQDGDQLFNEIQQMTGGGADPIVSPCVAAMMAYAFDSTFAYSVQSYGGCNLVTCLDNMAAAGRSEEQRLQAIMTLTADAIYGLAAFHKRVSEGGCMPADPALLAWVRRQLPRWWLQHCSAPAALRPLVARTTCRGLPGTDLCTPCLRGRQMHGSVSCVSAVPALAAAVRRRPTGAPPRFPRERPGSLANPHNAACRACLLAARRGAFTTMLKVKTSWLTTQRPSPAPGSLMPA